LYNKTAGAVKQNYTLHEPFGIPTYLNYTYIYPSTHLSQSQIHRMKSFHGN